MSEAKKARRLPTCPDHGGRAQVARCWMCADEFREVQEEAGNRRVPTTVVGDAPGQADRNALEDTYRRDTARAEHDKRLRDVAESCEDATRQDGARVGCSPWHRACNRHASHHCLESHCRCRSQSNALASDLKSDEICLWPP